MSFNTSFRIKKEYKDIQKSKAAGITADLVDNKFTHWKGTITGPDDTPYQGGVFVVDIKIGDQYPFQPPKMRFDTKIWHPNVSSQTGAICLDILKDEWSPALTLRTALLSLQALLSCPNADDPQDAVVAQQYKGNRQQYNTKAAAWTKAYANPNGDPEQQRKVKQLVDMGFAKSASKSALVAANWNVQVAASQLLTSL
jgi:ubiquitin-conjugating enzyme (huntingtin interacting protein 2)